MKLVDHFETGLDAPICLTWELTYACNLACVHCLSSSGRRDPRELSTAECEAVIDELQRMQVFYVNVGGGEPTVRKDFWHLLEYATAHDVGVKFSTNGSRITPERAAWLAASDYVDVQVSLDGATAAGQRRGPRRRVLRDRGDARWSGWPTRACADFKLSVVVTRENAGQLDDFKAIADRYGAQLRLTRLRPSGRGADVWDELHPTQAQQRALYGWLLAARRVGADRRLVLPPRRLRRRAAGAEPVRRGPRRLPDRPDRRRLRLPVRDPRRVPGRQRPLARRASRTVWRESELFQDLRKPQTTGACLSCAHYDACRGGCMAAKFFTGLPLDGPDPECVLGHGESLLACSTAPHRRSRRGDHSRRKPPDRRVRREPARRIADHHDKRGGR